MCSYIPIYLSRIIGTSYGEKKIKLRHYIQEGFYGISAFNPYFCGPNLKSKIANLKSDARST